MGCSRHSTGKINMFQKGWHQSSFGATLWEMQSQVSLLNIQLTWRKGAGELQKNNEKFTLPSLLISRKEWDQYAPCSQFPKLIYISEMLWRPSHVCCMKPIDFIIDDSPSPSKKACNTKLNCLLNNDRIAITEWDLSSHQIIPKRLHSDEPSLHFAEVKII